MVKAGDVYDIWFPFKPPILHGQPPGKFRPALILSVAADWTATAVAIKITGSGPTARFPMRVPIVDWPKANLEKESFAEIDSEIPIRISGSDIYRGTLEPHDFNNILVSYLHYTSTIRRGGTTT